MGSSIHSFAALCRAIHPSRSIQNPVRPARAIRRRERAWWGRDAGVTVGKTRIGKIYRTMAASRAHRSRSSQSTICASVCGGNTDNGQNTAGQSPKREVAAFDLEYR